MFQGDILANLQVLSSIHPGHGARQDALTCFVALYLPKQRTFVIGLTKVKE